MKIKKFNYCHYFVTGFSILFLFLTTQNKEAFLFFKYSNVTLNSRIQQPSILCHYVFKMEASSDIHQKLKNYIHKHQ